MGATKLLGHLLKPKMLDAADVLERCVLLLETEDFEALLAHLTFSGPSLEEAAKKEGRLRLPEIIERLEKAGTAAPRRIRFLIRDIVELRARKWDIDASSAPTAPKSSLKDFDGTLKIQAHRGSTT